MPIEYAGRAAELMPIGLIGLSLDQILTIHPGWDSGSSPENHGRHPPWFVYPRRFYPIFVKLLSHNSCISALQQKEVWDRIPGAGTLEGGVGRSVHWAFAAAYQVLVFP